MGCVGVGFVFSGIIDIVVWSIVMGVVGVVFGVLCDWWLGVRVGWVIGVIVKDFRC